MQDVGYFAPCSVSLFFTHIEISVQYYVSIHVKTQAKSPLKINSEDPTCNLISER